jgi:NDP-sugar pyrophosphorylase family protein
VRPSPPELSAIPALLLVGGQGTRLQAVVSDRPKPMAEVDGRPFLGFLLDWLAEAGIREVILCTGYMAEQLEAQLGERHGPLRLRYSRERSPLGTGGALRAALPLLGAPGDCPCVLVLNGDSFFGVPLADLQRFHVARGARATLALAAVPDTARYGRVEEEPERGQITSFVEKGAAGGPGAINGGVYLLDPALLAALPAERAVSLEREAFPAWLGGPFYGFAADAPFLDIGTPETYAAAPAFFRAGAPR